MAHQGKTSFKKIQIMAQADLSEGDDPHKSYEELSQFLEDKFKYEIICNQSTNTTKQ